MNVAITGYRQQSLTPATGHLNLELKIIFVGSLSLVQYKDGPGVTIKMPATERNSWVVDDTIS